MMKHNHMYYQKLKNQMMTFNLFALDQQRCFQYPVLLVLALLLLVNGIKFVYNELNSILLSVLRESSCEQDPLR